MEDILEVYKLPYDPNCPVVCMDEQPTQLIKETRTPVRTETGEVHYDYEYERNGTATNFMFTEPLGEWRKVNIREHKTATCWAQEIKELLDKDYPDAKKVILVCDNLNTHTPGSLYKAFTPSEARRLLNRLEIHYTPKHGSWLNVAEIELSILTRQCLDRRMPDIETLRREAKSWQSHRNANQKSINWQFTTDDARIKLKISWLPVENKKPAFLAYVGYIGVFRKNIQHRAKTKEAGFMKSVKFIGMDVHKKSIAIAVADEGRDSEVRGYGTIPNTFDALAKVIRKLLADGSELRFVYEAGPTGYGLYRHLNGNGFNCVVVAPSLIPKKSGNRIKNDRRDSIMLARLFRAGELTAIHIPHPEDEAMRDLTRAREDAKISERKAKQRLSGFLLRNGFIYSGKTQWSKAHFNWIAALKMEHPSQQLALQEYVDAIHESTLRVERFIVSIRELLPQWRWAPVVAALQSLRGVSMLTAVITVAELGDLSRFENPVALMSYLGAVPSEQSSGETVQRGGITKTGNGHVRRVLVEAAWAYRLPARKTRCLLKRQEGLSQSIIDIAWKAQVRLCSRYRHLMAKGKTKQVVVTAIARELAGFIWAIAQDATATI